MPIGATNVLAERLRAFTTTIFSEMSELAVATGSLNLGQGFPDTDGPAELMEVAIEAIAGGRNQYPPGHGVPELRAAVAAHQASWYGLSFSPEDEVLVTGEDRDDEYLVQKGQPYQIEATEPEGGEPLQPSPQHEGFDTDHEDAREDDDHLTDSSSSRQAGIPSRLLRDQV